MCPDCQIALESIVDDVCSRCPECRAIAISEAGLREYVDHVELSTPLSTDHFVRPARGSIYGLEPTPERFANRWLRPRSDRS